VFASFLSNESAEKYFESKRTTFENGDKPSTDSPFLGTWTEISGEYILQFFEDGSMRLTTSNGRLSSGTWVHIVSDNKSPTAAYHFGSEIIGSEIIGSGIIEMWIRGDELVTSSGLPSPALTRTYNRTESKLINSMYFLNKTGGIMIIIALVTLLVWIFMVAWFRKLNNKKLNKSEMATPSNSSD
jgi:hypothetical protein